ncbi:hypothetical protein [Thermostichus vulcanus]|uniref:Amidohydrolase-related domain-containing protein n=1 Tax=Thermostichus vulcanus str. 'Rupite' TaxID=2813851 RepID=A0ABT0C8S7_THEVL|nr:hypothetical protein [Thermostichus vulcanus]MCJ2542175.1 hypothetical protein [Thermostichus vulcanus str. 'Rupite']
MGIHTHVQVDFAAVMKRVRGIQDCFTQGVHRRWQEAGVRGVCTATVLGMVAHFTPEHVWDLCSNAARKAMGLPEVTLAPGSPAELLAIQGHHLTDALADGSEWRIVLHRGRVVANTTVEKQLIRA